MRESYETIFKLVGILLYLGVLLGIGAAASRRMKNMRDYFAGGKNLGFLGIAFSARATGESAWLLLGLTGMGAFVGVKAFWVVLGEVLGVMGAWLLMARRFKRLTDRYDSITIPDYLESRFRDDAQLLRRVAAIGLVVFVTIYVSAQIHATGAAFEGFLGWNYYVGALVGFVVVLIYIMSGGFVAVVWSDIFQGLLMFLGLVSLPIVGFVVAGGWGSVSEGLTRIEPNLLSWSGQGAWSLGAVLSVVGLVAIGVGFMGSPQIFVRFLALRDEGEINKGAGVAIAWTLLADSGAVLTGMVGRYLLTGPGDDVEAVLGLKAENVLPQLVEQLLPLALVGLFIAIVLSAIMSTVDSLLVLAASAVVRDYHQKVLHPELRDEALVSLSRWVTLGLAVGALAIAFGVAGMTGRQSVFWYVLFGWSGIAATFCPTIILSVFWRGMTKRGALAAMISGFLAVPLFTFVVPKLGAVGAVVAQLSELPPAMVLSVVIGVVVSLGDRAGAERLREVATELDEAAK
ncbi:sodium/proline symporter [Enhygromyxa salina]|uniref:Sodium/proline symporter n=1 Tax=Enhygromyxa salina TaxID=215803 RepID=A0A2S9Y875_9BACT|nr:sodium/proline symporter [Enhygromyxa salina]PRQ01221.1 Sodium/proline symporter [Enhygromyxa salina]